MNKSKGKRRHACFVYYQSFGQLLYREAAALQEAGYDVDIICLKTVQNEKFSQQYHGLQLYKINSRVSAEKTVSLYLFRLVCFFILSTFLLSYLSLKKRYAVIHVTSPPDVAVFTALIPKLTGARIILDIHDIGPELFMRKLNIRENHVIIKLLKLLERASARFSDHVITVTHIWKDRLVSRSVPPEKCSVLLNVPDPNIFKRYPANRRDNAKDFNLYYHGSLEEHFGVDTLLEAMPLIKEHIGRVNLHIYGGKRGRLHDTLVSYANSHNMGSYVTFYGGVPFYELPEILFNADIGMVPTKNSIFSDEAVSMKSLEYLFLGIPVVISRTQGHRYYYEDSMVKFFEPCNSFDLAKSVIELYEDKAKRSQQVENSQKFIEKNSWSILQHQYLHVIRSGSTL